MTHKAAVLPAKFATLEVQQLTTPKPGPGLLLIKTLSAAFNPVDYKIQKTGRFFDTFPRVIGGDVAGTVEAIGDGVTTFKPGDRVLSFAPYLLGAPGHEVTETGGFQQYTIALPHATSHVPEHFSLDEASTIPLAFCTVANGYYSFLDLARPPDSGSPTQAGQWVLVWGGAGSVGQYAVQLAHLGGYKVITTASPAGHEYLKTLGADVCVNYRDPDAVKQILKHTDGKLKLAYDAISDEKTIPQVLECLPSGGKAAFVQLTPENGLGGKKPPGNIEYTRVFAGKLLGDDKDTVGKDMFDWIGKALADGRLRGNPVELRSDGLEGAQATLDYYQKNGISGKKFVMRPHET